MIYLLRKLASLRDGFLVVGALLYSTGLAVWSYHAWRNNVGLLPALDMQYFIAGAVPLGVILIAYYIISHGRRAIEAVHSALGPDATGWRVSLRRTLYLAFFVCALLVYILGFLIESHRESEAYLEPALGACVFIGSACMIFAPLQLLFYRFKHRGRWAYRLIGMINPFMMYYTLVILSVLSVILFLNVVYPNIPQEFGGVRPRSAILTVKREDLPVTVLAKLAETDSPQSAAIRTRSVQVLFSDKDRLVFRLSGQVAWAETFEISRNSIKFIEWL